MSGWGGSRNSSGRTPKPGSERSKNTAVTYRLLPRNGYKGRAPKFPLPDQTDREKVIWRDLWRTPQAAIWAAEHHRMMSIGHYCRLLARCESPTAPGALFSQLHRYADQLGLTVRGMSENGWRLNSNTADAVTPQSDDANAEETTPHTFPTRRLRALPPVADDPIPHQEK